MRNKIKFHQIVVTLLFISSFFIVYGFINQDFPLIIRVISVFIFSSSATYLYMIKVGNKNIKRLEYLENRLKLWNSISYRVKKAGEMSFNQMPLGIIVYNQDKIIEWANNYAKEIFLSPLVERKIELINQELFTRIKLLTNFDIVLYGRTFGCTVLPQDNILYLVDKTEIKTAENNYISRMLSIGILNLDNLYQALTSLDAQEKALQISNIIGILGEWSSKYDIYLKGYSEEQYLLIMDYSQLQVLIDNKFKILEDIKDYCMKEGLRITASIGIACEDVHASNLVELAETQLSLALNRGGNQCVSYINGHVEYFGARTSSFENRSPVYVRVKAETLSDLIIKSSKVYIMAHKDTDADAFGASLAVSKIVKALNREGKIIFDESLIDETISNIYKIIQLEHVNVLDSFIHPKEALDKMTDDTLLIIVDCQYQNLLINEKVFKKAKKVAIIDHHRRNNFAINSYNFLYTQSSASSTIELIVEMFQFIENEIEISNVEATWMLMGVIVDTNNLMYRVSYRTFNVLAMLQKYGAEMPKVQRFLRENFDEYVERMTILNNLEIIDGKFGIAICNDDLHPRAFLAKIADNVITVSNIKAAFCIGKIENEEIGISARSLDEVNVQVIMEQMGGGGHFNNAATQIKDSTIQEIRANLIEKLKKIDEGGLSTMKIILTKDVKGKGKEREIIEIPSGHANFLVRSNQAILATVDNIKQLEKKQTEEKEKLERDLNEMKDLKVVVEKTPVTISVKVGKEGKLFGSVSSKQIIDEYKNQNGIVLDKRKMLYDRDVDSLGTYTIPIQLHKEVTANITLHVVEKE